MIRPIRSAALGTVLVASAMGAFAGCGGGSGEVAPKPAGGPPARHVEATESCCAGLVYSSRATGYYPANTRLQGGYVDRRGKKLRTLQDFVDGRAAYVSVAMDPTLFPYGQNLCIPELNAKYGKAIKFKVVDTGGAFKNRGVSRIDICNRTKKDTHDKSVNKRFDIVVCDR